MPAPVPVRIEHGSPTLLTSIAAQAGSAQARKRSQEQAYRMQLQQMAQDSALNRDELSRRFSSQRNLRQTSPTMLTDASGYAPRPQTFTNPGAQNDLQRLVAERQQQNGGLGYMPSPDANTLNIQNRLRTRASGVGPAQSAQRGSVSMVPSTGPYGQQPPHAPATLREQGTGNTFTRYPEGTTTITGAGATAGEAQQLREQDPRFAQAQQQMVTPQVRQQMDVVRAMQGAIPPAQYGAMLQAAQSGQLNMSQLVDDTRQFLPSQTASRQTAPEKQQDKARANAEVFKVLRTMPEDNQIAYAQSQRWFEPETPGVRESYDPKALAEMQQRNRDGAKRAIQSREVIADQLAGAYAGAPPMTGGGIGGVQNVTEAEAELLPAGTRFRLPDGRTGVTE